MTDCVCDNTSKADQKEECCCGPTARSTIRYHEIKHLGEIDTPVGSFPVVPTKLVWRDHLGSLSVRFGYGRMDYAVKPGLYAVGRPSVVSPVLVSANYKLSFDVLRRELSGLDCWILVLDTKGVNVWCAAGKGTFGTAEVVLMVKESELAHVSAIANWSCRS